MANAALEMVEPDPLTPGAFVPARVPAGGIYAHTMAEAYRGRARLRPGFSAADVRFDNVGYADWALESYATFARLQSEGVIPKQTRFQVSIPDPSIILNMHVWPDAQPAVGSRLLGGAVRARSLDLPRRSRPTNWPSSGTAPNPWPTSPPTRLSDRQ